MNHYKRRDFLKTALGASMAISIPKQVLSSWNSRQKTIRIGIITDLHQDIMHDGMDRLHAFVKHMKKVKPDALLQMGDFAYPGDKNKELINLFNQAHPVRMHVIGNHDTDAGFQKDQCIGYWGMPSRYYTQMIEGICCIVLDGNDKGSPTHKGGYPSYINPEQLQWLSEKLKETEAPVIIISHQPLAGELAVDNAHQIQELLSSYQHKILLAINGHTHINTALSINGVHYVHINSASYFWVGGNFRHDSYPQELIKDHPWIAYTCPYQEPLFATLTIDYNRLQVLIEGSSSKWVGKSPEELHYDGMPNLSRKSEIAPVISNRKFKRS